VRVQMSSVISVLSHRAVSGVQKLCRNIVRIPGVYAGFHFERGWMASARARAYNGGLGAVPPAASRAEPLVGVRGKPP